MKRGSEKQVELFTYVLEVGGHPVHFRVAGEGSPVILVHGLSGSISWWNRNIQALAAHHKVFLVDLPGFGAMRRRGLKFVLAEAAGWLQEWMKAAKVGQADLVGHSMGGYICLRLAIHAPKLVRRLVLVAPAGVPTGLSLPGQFIALLKTLWHASPSFLLTLVHDAMRAGPQTLWRAARDLISEDVREDLESIEAPTLLIWGENDHLIPPSIGYLLRTEITNSHILILKHAGHVPMFDSPREFNAAVLAFLTGQPVGE